MKKIYVLFIVFCCTIFQNFAQPTISFQNIITGLSLPVDFVHAGDNSGRMFIVEQGGLIKIWNGTNVVSTPFLNISSIISKGGERGLLSLAFHPNYVTNRYFFVYYTNLSSDITIARYQVKANNANEADATTATVLMNIPKNYANHNGGKLNFGNDGFLYFGTGDGGSGGDPDNNAQNGNSLLGKMLRIDVNNFNTPPYYTVPSTNPYVGNSNVKPEIIALGLRNPWRWCFDKQTGDMWIADVGQGVWEEVNFKAAGNIISPTNYGWRCYEGNSVYTTCTPEIPTNNLAPIFQYDHSNNGGYSITGGLVYRGTEYPDLQGYYLCTDYVINNGWLIKNNGNNNFTVTKQTGWLSNIASFGESQNGTMYAVSLNGIIAKVVATTALPLALTQFTVQPNNLQHIIEWSVLQEYKGDKYMIERSVQNALQFETVYNTQANNNNSKNTYKVAINATVNTVFYRLKIINANGKTTYSSIVSINNNNAIKNQIKAYRSSNNTITITTQKPITNIQIIDASGRMIAEKKLQGIGSFYIENNLFLQNQITFIKANFADASTEVISIK
ncbi:MAG: PQQ-dependent sugar dehydrogenase [Chitinophagaceae bacterium]